jgi:mRNA-degrading endonuclease RelE of RelBE toxin-antitoxin system
MTAPEFTEYAVKQTKLAVASRGRLSVSQQKELDEIVWRLADDPRRFEPLSTKTKTGQLLYRGATSSVELVYSVDADRKIVYFFHFSAPLPPRHTIFISYSHEDIRWLRLLRKFLTGLEADGAIKFWDDSNLKPGEPWEEGIRKALDAACAAVLLVSQDFLASKFITTYELPRLLSDAAREGKKIFWIQVSSSTVFVSHKEITVFQSLTDDPEIALDLLTKPKQKKLLVKVAERLQRALEEA